tara:strand:+ start:365 stop:568 length:204 start_codon:yes stop_codon:yes gene_type:complete
MEAGAHEAAAATERVDSRRYFVFSALENSLKHFNSIRKAWCVSVPEEREEDSCAAAAEESSPEFSRK